jgi:hypothetical protein
MRKQAGFFFLGVVRMTDDLSMPACTSFSVDDLLRLRGAILDLDPWIDVMHM